jgi:hypothetical protein
LPSSIVSSALTWCGGASSSREPSSIPAGYASHTGYQYDSISRVAGQRELAPPSKFSNDGGFRNNVFNGISGYINILCYTLKAENPSGYKLEANGRLAHWAAMSFPMATLQLKIIQAFKAFRFRTEVGLLSDLQ